MRDIAALSLLALMGACAQLPRTENPAPSELSRSWLVGSWVPQGESCESDAGIRYNADGTWAAYEVAGIWRLDGSALLFIVTENGSDGAEAPGPVHKRYVVRIEVLDPDAYRSRWQDETIMTLQRCPS